MTHALELDNIRAPIPVVLTNILPRAISYKPAVYSGYGRRLTITGYTSLISNIYIPVPRRLSSHNMPRRIKTTETSFAIIDLLKEHDGATMNELSDRLGLANSTIYGHLKTLEEHRLIVKEGNEYNVGLRFFYYGNYAKQRKPEYQYAEQRVEQLASITKESANFCVEEHGQITILHGDSISSDPAYDIGGTFSMHNTAVGKAILAQMSNEKVSAVVDRWGLPESTEQTITDKAKLFDDLDEIRRRGYAFNREELMSGLSAVGAVVERPDSSVVGALSAGGASYRIEGERLEQELPEALLRVKEDFEDDIRSLYLPT